MSTAERPIKVVLVDDHEMFADSIVRILSGEPGIEVVGSVGTVAEAVDLVHQTKPDVVVMDHRLPDGDGISASGLLRHGRLAPQVLLLTGDTTNERLLLQAIEAGCAGFLTKDRAISELVDAIRVIAGGESWVPPDLVTRLLPRLDRTHRGLGSDLTRREIDVLQLAAQGMNNAAIAAELHLSVNTVRNHVQNAITKLQAHSKLEAVSLAVREGIVSFPSPSS